MRFHRALTAAVATVALAVPLVAASVPASAARQAPGVSARAGHKHTSMGSRRRGLPRCPRPPAARSWGYLGQLYAIAAGNLASHFGKVTAEP